MIFDHLNEQGRYRNCHPGLDLAFDFLRNFDPATPDGRIELDGDRVFALVQRYTTRSAEGRDFESHYQYVDLQYLATGEEAIYHHTLDGLSESIPYDEQRDIIFYRGPATQAIHLKPGMFAVLFPQDAHLPSAPVTEPGEVLKVVVKLRVQA